MFILDNQENICCSNISICRNISKNDKTLISFKQTKMKEAFFGLKTKNSDIYITKMISNICKAIKENINNGHNLK